MLCHASDAAILYLLKRCCSPGQGLLICPRDCIRFCPFCSTSRCTMAAADTVICQSAEDKRCHGCFTGLAQELQQEYRRAEHPVAHAAGFKQAIAQGFT